MAFVLEQPRSLEALTEFARFHDAVYADRSARWPANVSQQIDFLSGASAAAAEREVLPLVAREAGRIVARVAAVLDRAYLRHWREPLGHLVFFEALPTAGTAVDALLDEAARWLADRRLEAVRLGFLGTLDVPLTIDAYETLPPVMLRHNPPHYHAMLKQAGFETEQGWVDYRIEVTPALLSRWEENVTAVARGGIELVALRELSSEQRLADYTTLWNHAFEHHWGHVPFREDEVAELFRGFGPIGGLDTSLLAYRGEEPVGALMVVPSLAEFAELAPGRVLAASEALNVLGIGVHESARGRGIAQAMASHAYRALAEEGARYLSYTLVLDDNWPSRRTGESLGGRVCANYVTYRRALRR